MKRSSLAVVVAATLVAAAVVASAQEMCFRDIGIETNGLGNALKMIEVPGQDRFLLMTQDGTISNINKVTGATSSVFLDITGLVSNEGEKGLLGLAVAPGFPDDSPYFYVYYSSGEEAQHESIIAQYEVMDGDDTRADPSSAKVIMTVQQPYGNHNGGDIWFGGNDCMLYVALGDGGDQNNGQNMMTPLSKILRIDPNEEEGGYSVPTDNPFYGQAGIFNATWASGLRNPWRGSQDRLTKELYSGDVGAGTKEEVNLLVKGGNYGWPLSEGTVGTDGDPPIFDYDNPDAGVSVIGGYIYHGPYDSLRGKYVFGDWIGGMKLATKAGDGSWSWEEATWSTENGCINPPGPMSFAEDLDGHVYLLHADGALRIEASDGVTTEQTFDDFYAGCSNGAGAAAVAFAVTALAFVAALAGM